MIMLQDVEADRADSESTAACAGGAPPACTVMFDIPALGLILMYQLCTRCTIETYFTRIGLAMLTCCIQVELQQLW